MSKVFKSFKKGSTAIARALGYDKVIKPLRKKGTPPPIEGEAIPDEEDLRRARQRSLAAQAARTGRSSTILTDDEDTLG